MSQCVDCGEKIEFRRNWRGQWVVLDPDPPEWVKESYVEVAKGEFVSVFRHQCEARKKSERR